MTDTQLVFLPCTARQLTQLIIKWKHKLLFLFSPLPSSNSHNLNLILLDWLTDWWQEELTVHKTTWRQSNCYYNFSSSLIFLLFQSFFRGCSRLRGKKCVSKVSLRREGTFEVAHLAVTTQSVNLLLQLHIFLILHFPSKTVSWLSFQSVSTHQRVVYLHQHFITWDDYKHNTQTTTAFTVFAFTYFLHPFLPSVLLERPLTCFYLLSHFFFNLFSSLIFTVFPFSLGLGHVHSFQYVTRWPFVDASFFCLLHRNVESQISQIVMQKNNCLIFVHYCFNLTAHEKLCYFFDILNIFLLGSVFTGMFNL